MEASALAREQGCDFIVALGGGAVLDASVAVAAMAASPVLCGTGRAAARARASR